MRKAIAISVLLVIVLSAAITIYAEENDPYADPGAPRAIWQLDFHRGIKTGDGDPFDPEDKREWKFDKPIEIVIKEETGNPEAYWFILYTIKNKDAEEHPTFINVSAISDKANASGFEVSQDTMGEGYSKKDAMYTDLGYPDVKKVIEKKYINELGDQKLWGWDDLTMSKEGIKETPDVRQDGMDEGINLPMIKPGEYRRCVAIFKKMDPEARTIEIFFEGLNNDFRMLTHLENRSLNEYQRQIKAKVLRLVFKHEGGRFQKLQYPITFVKEEWVEWTMTYTSDLKHDPEYEK